MATALIGAEKQTALEPRQSFVLTGVDWATYRKISDALTNNHVRLTYDRGVMELMSKSILHEILSRLYYRILLVLTEEFDLPLLGCGSMTCDRQDLARAAEPDECFYLINAALMRGKEQIDLAIDPAPDLVVEIDLTTSSKRRLEVYAALKVPEVWLVDVESLTVLQLGASGDYAVAEQSKYFPGIAVAEFPLFVQRRKEGDENALFREFRAWVQGQMAQGD